MIGEHTGVGFGKLGVINHPDVTGGGGAPPSGDALLLEDGTSFLLLEDGAAKLLLG